MITKKHQIQSIVITALEKGFIYTCILCFIATVLFVTTMMLDFESSSNLNDFSSKIIFELISLIIFIFLFIGLPTTAIPAAIGSVILARWLYHDWTKNNLALKSVVWKSISMGVFFSIPTSLFWILTEFHRINLNEILASLINQTTSPNTIFLICSPPIFGAIAGYKLGSFLLQQIKREFDNNPS